MLTYAHTVLKCEKAGIKFTSNSFKLHNWVLCFAIIFLTYFLKFYRIRIQENKFKAVFSAFLDFSEDDPYIYIHSRSVMYYDLQQKPYSYKLYISTCRRSCNIHTYMLYVHKYKIMRISKFTRNWTNSFSRI